MQNLRFLVHLATDTVAAIFPHDAVIMPLGVTLDGMADIAQRRAGSHGSNPLPQGLIGHTDQP